MFYYLSRCSFLFLMLFIFGLLTSCAPQSEIDALEKELEELKNPKPNVEAPNIPQQPTVIYTPAPVASSPPVKTPTYGPGNANNTFTPSSGFLSIQTNSANGKLCLRANAAQSATCLIEIPNGVGGLSYTNRFQVGDYVWYETSYGSYYGYVRGDYVYI